LIDNCYAAKRIMSPNEFTTKFGKVARTLEYEDPQGHLVFTFDLGSGGDKSLCLEHFTPQSQRVPRYRVAFERAKEYLESCGYQVEIFGAFAPAPSMSASDVTKLIQAELSHHKLPETYGSSLAGCLSEPRRSEFRLHPENTIWDMWLVFEEPVHGFRIVFDEHSKQFGVAKHDVFLGFYGTFLQTLDALSKTSNKSPEPN
jgi:hypothetical protein